MLSTCVYGTAIVAIVTPRSITLGVDSKSTDLVTLSCGTASKLYQANKFLFALGGLHFLHYHAKDSELNKDNAYAYRPYDFVANILKSGENLKRIEETIHTQWAHYIFSFLGNIQRHSETDFSGILKDLRISSLFITGIEMGVPGLLVLNAVIKDAPEGPSCEVSSNLLTTEDKELQKEGCRCYAYVTEETFHQIDKQLACKKPEEEIERLISLEFVNNQKFTGPPVDIYQLNRKGLTWIKRKNGVPVHL